jgi:hypothetical protein
MTDMKADGEKKGHTWGTGGRPAPPLMVPVKTPFVARRGDSVHSIGDVTKLRDDHDGPWYDPPLFGMLARRLPFGPLIQMCFVRMPSFSEDDWRLLEVALGSVIPESDRDLIDAASELLVNTVALGGCYATWKQLREQLETIRKPATALLGALEMTRPAAPTNGALPAAQTVGAYITTALSGAPYALDHLMRDLTNLVAFCGSAMEAAKNGPGTLEQAELRYFLRTLAEVATRLGIPLKLLGHDPKVDLTDEVAPAERENPKFFEFAREVIRLANRHVMPGISKSELTDIAKDAALKTLNSYAQKSDKALSMQLERLTRDTQKRKPRPKKV